MREFLVNEQHLAELRGSGIDDEMIVRSGIYSAEGKRICTVLGWTPKQFSFGPGFIIPFLDQHGSATDYARVKLDYPRHRDSDPEQPIKYESPLKKSNRAYFPPGFRMCRELLITEGEKKTLAAACAGYSCIGLVGVFGFQQKRLKDDHGNPYCPPEFIDDLDRLSWTDVHVTIVFDSDAVSNSQVRLAEYRLANILFSKGALVRVARIPAVGDAKVGLDDYLVANGSDALRHLIAEAKVVEQPAKPAPVDLARDLIADLFQRDGIPTMRFWRGDFYRWDGRCYQLFALDEIRGRATLWLSRCRQKHTRNAVADVVAALQAELQVPASVEPPCWLTKDCPSAPNVLSFQNRLVSLLPDHSAVERPHSPKLFSRVAMDYWFDREATCPAWHAFLEAVFGEDQQRIQLLQEWLGYLLTSDTSCQKMFVLMGPPRAGKGLICRLIARLVGENNVSTPTLTDLAGGFGLWPLVGKSVAIVPDAHIGRGADAVRIVETLKSISGEDAQNIDRKYRDPMIGVRLGVRFVLTANDLPSLSDASGALVKRFSILPFDRSFLGKEDPGLEGRLRGEVSGIVNWALDGSRRLREQGAFSVPDIARPYFDSYARLISPVKAFVEDVCELDPNAEIPTADLYGSYRDWCESNGHKPSGADRFGEQLRSVCPGVRRERPTWGGKRVYVYVGIRHAR